MITDDVRELCERAVLCWLATADGDGRPNVSPKETFVVEGESVWIADVASPRSVANLSANPWACVAVVDVFAQRGYQLRGPAIVHDADSSAYREVLPALRTIAPEPFPIRRVLEVRVEQVQPIVAPSAWLFPDEDAVERRSATLAAYGVVDATSTQSSDTKTGRP